MHSIRVHGQKMSFSAAHFVIGADYCENLHGHNYTVEVFVSGSLDAAGMVLDFKEVKKQTINVCSLLDHKVLLPGKSDLVAVEEAGISYEVKVIGKRYVFPKEDCIIIPYSATTAELIAEYISSELRLAPDHRIKVCVSENVGSTGCYDTGVS